MGCGTEKNSQSSSNSGTSETVFKPASPEEERLLGQFGSLGDAQKEVLLGLMRKANGDGSMFALTPQDQAQVDASYGSARQQLETGMRDFADFNAGGRGMRMSDTPVAQQALQRYGLGLSDLESQKANTGLNLGFMASQARDALGLNTIGAMPSGYAAAFSPLYNERMASGKTTTTGNFTGTSSHTASPLQQVSQGTQAFSQFGGGLNQFAQGGKILFPSDVNLKRDITPFAWKWKDGDEKEYLGVIAQDVERSHPHLVTRTHDGTLHVDYGALTAMLLTEREALYGELGELRKRLAGVAIA